MKLRKTMMWLNIKASLATIAVSLVFITAMYIIGTYFLNCVLCFFFMCILALLYIIYREFWQYFYEKGP